MANDTNIEHNFYTRLFIDRERLGKVIEQRRRKLDTVKREGNVRQQSGV